MWCLSFLNKLRYICNISIVNATAAEVQIFNPLPVGARIVLVEDVITTGRSVRRACEALTAQGCLIVGVVGLIDLEVGGKAALEKNFPPVTTLFTLSDFVTH